MSRLGKLLRLSWRERRLLAGALFMLPLTSVALRVAGVGRVLGWIERSGRDAGMPTNGEEVEMIVRSVALASRGLPLTPTCLTQSAWLHWLLRRNRVSSSLCLGVQADKGTFGAHAWVEVDGRPVNDVAEIGQRFARLPSVDDRNV